MYKLRNVKLKGSSIKFVKLVLVCGTSLLAACTSTGSEKTTGKAASDDIKTNMKNSMVYVGTYAEEGDETIFLYNLNSETGELLKVHGIKAGANPSYLVLDDQRKHLYTVNETGDYKGMDSGAVSAFAVDGQTGDLTFLNRVASKGGAPCHISIDKTGKTVLVANYMGGNVASFGIQPDGELSEAVDVVEHTGQGPNENRQEAPHAHYVAADPANRYALAVDLGTDKILGYKLDASQSKIIPNEPNTAYTTVPGAGPRHLAFHPNGRYAYLINELNSTVDVLLYYNVQGTFIRLQTIPTIPADYKENNQCAAIEVSADGKFVYGSNRGHNSIVVYKVDAATGKLTLVEHENTGGDWPRDFSIDPTGSILLVANERSNNIVTFKVDKETGKLINSGYEAAVSKPTCLQVIADFR